MKTIITSLIFSFWCIISTAQITAIPDPGFEQALIIFNIDSDGIVNGQVLTSDIANITELEIDDVNGNSSNIYSLTGIEAFTNLEKLIIRYSYINTLDISQNLQLRHLNCSNNMLTHIDISNNLLLEKLDVSNYGGDVGPFNDIAEIDLSNNPNISTVNVFDMYSLNTINLENGNNNSEMNINIGFSVWDGPSPEEPINSVCIQVDNEELAQNNQLPYSEWNIDDTFAEYNFSENCNLSTSKFQKTNTVSLYPNPATNIVNITSREPVTEAAMYNLLGQKVKQLPAGSTTLTTDVSSLTAGTYFVVVKTGTGNSTLKVIIN